MNAPLTGMKILDFTHLLPGELCSAVLSDLGAEVVRIESPTARLSHTLPPIIKGESLYYWSLRRDQKRILVDLKSKEGRALVEKLVPEFDVVLENFRPGVMERFGLGYKQLSAINKKLIYCSVSGYGQTSPKRETPVHDLNLIAETGLLQLNCRDGERPVLPSIPVSDYMAGIFGALSVVGALLARERGSDGAHLDVSMEDSAISTLNILGSMILYTKQEPSRGGFAYPRELPNYNVYECSDGRFLAVASLERHFWEEFCRRIAKPELTPKIDQPELEKELIDEIARTIKSKTLTEWEKIFAGSNCCVSTVKSAKEAFDKYPLAERGMLAILEHPLLGKIPQIIFPVDRSLRRQTPAGANGDDLKHMMKILNEAGYSDESIDKLIEQRIISMQRAAVTTPTRV